MLSRWNYLSFETEFPTWTSSMCLRIRSVALSGRIVFHGMFVQLFSYWKSSGLTPAFGFDEYSFNEYLYTQFKAKTNLFFSGINAQKYICWVAWLVNIQFYNEVPIE